MSIPYWDTLLAGAIDALATADDEYGTPGPSDLAALVRQCLVREWTGGAPHGLVVPALDGWPDSRGWHEFGCSCVPHDVTTFWITPKAWTPDWLGRSDLEAITAAFREERRRQWTPVTADSVVSELVPSIRGQYVSAGQQEAVRSAFIAPLGATVLVCLPTGGGKTLALQAPALHGIDQKKLVVVIVPTVALARDQERRFRELLSENRFGSLASKPLAYHSGLDKDDRAALFEGLRDGTIPIVFTSPEAALGALRRPLLGAARAGRVALFAVDEAHMVSQWGDSFRPEFQLVAGLRDEMQRAAVGAEQEPFPTLLLTATLTEEGYVTLKQAFERDAGFYVVGEARLREEPAIVVADAKDAETRTRRVLDALPYLPRPMILYTTERKHADSWGEALWELGHRRVKIVKGGDMATRHGEEVLEAWTKRRLDIVVATSAFGLGVDQGDVRTVVHACFPESVDRYYQEVGRSGRDGAASVALLLPAEDDRPVAESLASNPSISIERGLERWNAMINTPVSTTRSAAGGIVVSLTARPRDVAYTSDLNVAWNQRTLVLMARAGLIEFACVPPPECEPREGETPEQFEARRAKTFEADALTAAVRIAHDGHRQVATWKELVEPLRRWLRRQDDLTLDRMRDLVTRRTTPEALFRDVYTVESAGLYPPVLGLEPEVVGLGKTRCRLGDELWSLLETSSTDGRLFVHYEMPSGFLPLRKWRTEVAQRTLERLARAGVLEFDFGEDFFEGSVWKSLAARSPIGFVCRADGSGIREARARARVTVLGPKATAAQVRAALELERDHHVLLFPSDALDPINQPRRLIDSYSSISLRAFAGRLAQ